MHQANISSGFSRVLAACVGILISTASFGQQTITIEECYQLARQNFPMVKQMELIEKTKEYNLDNANKGYLPKLSINGQVTYQSDVTSIGLDVPGIDIPQPTKDQYKFYGEVNQSLLDWTVIGQQKEILENDAQVESQKLEVELYKLKERVNQIYFGILLMDAQEEQVGLLKKDIQSGIDKMTAAYENGVALKSSIDVLKAEMLKADQKTIELQANRKAFVDMLSLLVNKQLGEDIQLNIPAIATINSTIARPELMLYDYQKTGIQQQDKLITVKNFPKLGLFVQGGYAKPGLNFLSNEFDPYYIGGIRLNWNLSGYYTTGKERQLLQVRSSMVDLQKETFLFNTHLNLKQQNGEIAKLEELMAKDQEIIQLRGSIKKTANTQLEKGVITSNDYLKEVNAEDQARQNMTLHQIQLLMAQYNYQTTSGN